MNFYIGTSGYSFTKWRGTFYPTKLSPKEMLSYYATRFQSVEINNTFYNPPIARVLSEWVKQVPATFRFILKAPQRITHFRRLKGVGKFLSSFLKTAGTLGIRLGPVFFQLPPNFKKDVPRLRAFLALFRSRCRVAMEFRHLSWFDDEVFELLSDFKTALCIADAEGDLQVPFVATTDWGYVRLRRAAYNKGALKSWAARMKAQSWRDCFVFFKHEDTGMGPKLASQLLNVIAASKPRKSE